MTDLVPGRDWRGWKARIFLFILGGLAVLGQAPFHIWPLSLLCLAIFFAWLRTNKHENISGFWMSLWFAFGYFMCGTYWIGSAFIERGPEFIPVMPPMVAGLALLLALFWGLAGLAYQKWIGNGWRGWLGLIGLFALAELTRGHLFGGFPWNLWGYIFPAGSSLSQSISIFGSYGLSTLVFSLAALMAVFLTDRKNIKPLIGAGIILAGLFGFGQGRLSGAENSFHPDVQMRLIQTPFEQRDRFDANTSIEISRQFIRLSLEPGIEQITHLVWPEGAVPGIGLENEGLMIAMGGLLADYGGDTPPIWLFNTLRREKRAPDSSRDYDYYYNSSTAIKIEPDGTAVVAAYNDKYRLVPFGEIIPGGGWLEKLGAQTISTSLASITPAPSKQLAEFPGLPTLSPQICYEVIFPGLTPRGGSNGEAEWILNQSNDAWFGKAMGPYQHANITAYRAIETGLPIVRSASNGVSGIIDPYGRYIKRLDPKEEGVLDFELPKSIDRPFAFSGLILWITLINILLVITALTRFNPAHDEKAVSAD